MDTQPVRNSGLFVFLFFKILALLAFPLPAMWEQQRENMQALV